MILVMFDIDGTLTQTYEADERCFVQSLREVFGFCEIDTDWSGYPHCSDAGILEALFQTRCGRSPRPAEAAAFQSHFLSLLAAASAAEPFLPVPGAREFLSALLAGSEFAVSLASGAWESSGRLKLTSAGLDFSQVPAAFSDEAHPRESIMQVSLKRAANSHSRDSFDSVVYVGDGVWDARASRNLGFRFIGRAHEPAKIDRLHAEGARHIFADYRDPAALLAALRSSE